MVDDGEEIRYSIGELAELGGVSRRTVRYYVQRGLLPAPTGVGRGRHYTGRHLDTLIRVRRLQESGHGLAEIGERLRGASSATELRTTPRTPAVSRWVERVNRWTRIEIADGVELHLRDVRLDSRQLRSVGAAIRRALGQGGRR